MRTSRILGLFVALAVALGLATVPATAQAAATLPSQLSIKAAKAVYYGKTFTVSGRFTTKVGNTTYYVDDVDVDRGAQVAVVIDRAHLQRQVERLAAVVEVQRQVAEHLRERRRRQPRQHDAEQGED